MWFRFPRSGVHDICKDRFVKESGGMISNRSCPRFLRLFCLSLCIHTEIQRRRRLGRLAVEG